MPTPQRLPIVDSDDGVWGDILRQYLMKEHVNDDTDNTVNGGHRTVTIAAGTATAGTAPLKFASGTLMSAPEAGAVEFVGDNLYVTQTSGNTRKKVALYDDSSGASGDIYYRNASGYFARLGIGSNGDVLTLSGGLPSWQVPSTSFTDSSFVLRDNSDTSKQLKFELSGISTATTRTLTVPNSSTVIVGTNAAQTLTNKTLTGPRINQINDTNGGNILDLVPISSAVNRFYLTNQSSGNYPTLGVDGSDTNIGFTLAPKGNGPVRIYATAGQTPTLDVAGPDTNLDFNLIAKGSGIVQANGIEVATTSGTQTLTNKTLGAPTVTGNPVFTGQPVVGDYSFTSATLHLKGGSGGNPILQMSRGSGSTPSTMFDFALAGGGFSIRDVDASKIALNVFAASGSSEAYVGQKLSIGDYSNVTGTISASTHNSSAGNNVGGPNLIVQGGGGTGIGVPGDIQFKTFSTTTSGSNVQSSTVRATIAATTGIMTIATPGTGPGSVVSVDGDQTLTNKSINLSSNTLTGTVAQFNAAISDGDLATSGDLDEKADVLPLNSTDLLVDATLKLYPGGNDFTMLPFILNDLMYNDLRGGSVVITKNGDPYASGAPENMFRPDVTNFSASTISTDEWVITVGMCTTWAWRIVTGIYMDPSFRFEDVGIEIYFDGSWASIYSVTGSNDEVHRPFTNTMAGSTVSQIRFTLSRSVNTTFRINSLFALSHSGPLLSAAYLDRMGGEIYGHISDSLDPTSSNHLARKEYVDGKVSRTSSAYKVYVTNGSGETIDIDYSSATATPGTMVYRGANGVTTVGDPTNDGHAANKLYVDTELSGKTDVGHMHDAVDISNSTSVGRSLMTATSAAAARSTIGAGTGDGDVTLNDTQILTNKTISGNNNTISDIVATTSLTATGTKSSSTYLRGDNTWATPPNTTYAEITSAEITAGTATTLRTISGRRAQEIVNKAVAASGDVTVNGAQTLTNKTLSAGVLSGTTELTDALNFTPDSGTFLAFDGDPVIVRYSGANNKSIGIGADDTIYIGAGESRAQMDSNISPGGEALYLGAESGVTIVSSPDNWSSSWAGRVMTTIDSTGITWDGNIVWHAGNDGSGSGLDADTVDGQHASAFATTSSVQTLTNKTISASSNTISNIAVSNLAASAVVTESEGIGSNDNDTTIPTSAAVKDYVDTAAGAGSIAWQEVTSTSQTAVANGGYIANNASLVTITLPTTAAVGSTVRVIGKGAGGWRIAQNSGETIHFGASSTIAGTGGYIGSTNRYDTAEIICVTANTTWVVASSVGNITVA